MNKNLMNARKQADMAVQHGQQGSNGQQTLNNVPYYIQALDRKMDRILYKLGELLKEK